MHDMVQHLVAIAACILIAFVTVIVGICLGGVVIKVVDKFNQFLTK